MDSIVAAIVPLSDAAIEALMRTKNVKWTIPLFQIPHSFGSAILQEKPEGINHNIAVYNLLYLHVGTRTSMKFGKKHASTVQLISWDIEPTYFELAFYTSNNSLVLANKSTREFPTATSTAGTVILAPGCATTLTEPTTVAFGDYEFRIYPMETPRSGTAPRAPVTRSSTPDDDNPTKHASTRFDNIPSHTKSLPVTATAIREGPPAPANRPTIIQDISTPINDMKPTTVPTKATRTINGIAGRMKGYPITATATRDAPAVRKSPVYAEGTGALFGSTIDCVNKNLTLGPPKATLSSIDSIANRMKGYPIAVTATHDAPAVRKSPVYARGTGALFGSTTNCVDKNLTLGPPKATLSSIDSIAGRIKGYPVAVTATHDAPTVRKSPIRVGGTKGARARPTINHVEGTAPVKVASLPTSVLDVAHVPSGTKHKVDQVSAHADGAAEPPLEGGTLGKLSFKAAEALDAANEASQTERSVGATYESNVVESPTKRVHLQDQAGDQPSPKAHDPLGPLCRAVVICASVCGVAQLFVG